MHIERKILLFLAPIRLRMGRYGWKFKTWCHAVWCRLIYKPTTAKIKIEARQRSVRNRNSAEIANGTTPIGLMVTRLSSVAEHYNRNPQDLNIWKPVERSLTGVGSSTDIEFTCMLMMINEANEYLDLFKTCGDLTSAMENYFGEYNAVRYPCWHRKTIAVGGDIEVVDK